MYVPRMVENSFVVIWNTSTLTSLLVQHNQSPDTSIFTLRIKNHGEEGWKRGWNTWKTNWRI